MPNRVTHFSSSNDPILIVTLLNFTIFVAFLADLVSAIGSDVSRATPRLTKEYAFITIWDFKLMRNRYCVQSKRILRSSNHRAVRAFKDTTCCSTQIKAYTNSSIDQTLKGVEDVYVMPNIPAKDGCKDLVVPNTKEVVRRKVLKPSDILAHDIHFPQRSRFIASEYGLKLFSNLTANSNSSHAAHGEWLNVNLKRLSRRLGTLNKRLRQITQIEKKNVSNYDSLLETTKLKISSKAAVTKEIKQLMRLHAKYKVLLRGSERSASNKRLGRRKPHKDGLKQEHMAARYYTDEEFSALLEGGTHGTEKVQVSFQKDYQSFSYTLLSFLTHAHIGTKELIKIMIKNGLVRVNCAIVVDENHYIDITKDKVMVLNDPIKLTEREVYSPKRLSCEQYRTLKRQRNSEITRILSQLEK